MDGSLTESGNPARVESSCLDRPADFLNRIAQSFQKRIDLIIREDQGRQDTDRLRTDQRTRDHDAAFEKARGNLVTHGAVSEVHSEQQPPAGNLLKEFRMI